MRTLCACLVVAVALSVAASAQAQTMTLIEDFEAYPEATTVHDQGDWTMLAGPAWQAQRNSSALGDPGWSTVEDMGGRNVLQMINRDTGGELDTVYTAMWLGTTNEINTTGTIYVRFMAMQDGDTLIAINDNGPGWDYGGIETGDAGAPSFQGTATGVGGFGDQASLVELNAEPWRARNGGGYEQGLAGQPTRVAGQWYELWMQVDVGNKQTRYYQCADGDTPTLVPTGVGGEWWAFRDVSNSKITSLKFFIDLFDFETQTYLDSVAINSAEFSTERFAGWSLFPALPTYQADFDGDGDVDLDDFVILKNGFGIGTTHAEGDADLDGDVDLDDFVILKQEFGT